MIKDDGSFDKASCRAFGLAAHTLAALIAAVIHNLEQTRRTRNRDNHNSSTHNPDQTTPNTTPSATPHQPHTHPGTPINQPRPVPHRRDPPVEPDASTTRHQHHP